MTSDLRKKYEMILRHEEQFAYTLAKKVVKKPEASAWMILIPILFVHHIMKINQYKAGVKTFAENILGTKQKALDKAYLEAESGKKVNYEVEDYFSQVSLVADEEKILAQKQVRAIRIMEEHYLAMLNVQGDALEDLIRGVYSNQKEYRQYLSRLAETEKEVNQYLMDNFHSSQESRIVVRKIEEENEALREEELKFFFQH